jgi:hypothetical protein
MPGAGIDATCNTTTLIRIPKIVGAITPIEKFALQATLQAERTSAISIVQRTGYANEPVIFALLE